MVRKAMFRLIEYYYISYGETGNPFTLMFTLR